MGIYQVIFQLPKGACPNFKLTSKKPLTQRAELLKKTKSKTSGTIELKTQFVLLLLGNYGIFFKFCYWCFQALTLANTTFINRHFKTNYYEI